MSTERNLCYYSQRLRQKLDQIQSSRITLVESGAGYGKTTAVREALKTCERVYWYTASEDNTVGNYANLCYLVAEFCPEAAQAMAEFELPNRSNAAAISAVLYSMRCDQPVYFVLDNFHYSLSYVAQPLLSAIFNLPERNIHVIVIAHDVHRCVQSLSDPTTALIINRDDLMLSRGEIAEYYSLYGVQLTQEQTNALEKLSEGWIVVLSLHLSRCVEAGMFIKVMNMHEILTNLIWNRLDEEAQDRLITYSFFDRLSFLQICELENTAELSEASRRLLSRLPLVRLGDTGQRYELHTVLRKYLIKQAETLPPERMQASCRRAGDWCRRHGDTIRAIACFHCCDDIEGILSLDLIALFRAKINSIPFEDIAEHIALTASEELMARHPIAMLRLAYYLFGACRFSQYNALMAVLKKIIVRANDPALLGEWTLMDAYSVFPDLTAMGERYRQAARLINGVSRAVSNKEPYMFGCTSMWQLFHTQSGDMEKNADLLSQVLAVYTSLTDNHGDGADELYRGECYCVQGRFDEAEICAHKAAYKAAASKQVSVAYGAALLLGVIAIYQNDGINLKKAIDHLEAKASHYTCYLYHDTPLNTCMLETVRGYLLGLMLLSQNYPEWVHDDGDVEMNLTFVNFMVYQSRITELVLNKKYRIAIARIEVLLGSDPRLCSAAARNFMLAGLALCYLAIGKINKAVEALEASLTIAAPDHNYTFLARLRKVFGVLFLHPRIAGKHQQAIREIRALKIDYAGPDEELLFQGINPLQLPEELTPRERQIALMAAGGMRNREIAKGLSIKEATVKSHMNVVFQKLNIDRRSKILEMLG